MKKLLALIATSLVAIPLAQAQTETGTSAGAMALDRARSAPISAGGPTTEATVSVVDGKSMGKEVVVVEEEDKWWSFNASTGWDSLYMFRGVNILGNGRGIYWLGGDIGITPWENGAFTAGVWYGVSSSTSVQYQELDVFLDYTHSFGPVDASFGWVYYHYPTLGSTSQNELYWALAYNLEVGPVTITPNATYFLNVGDLYAGSSYLLLQLDASMPVTDWLAVEPYVAYGINFGFNGRDNGTTFDGGNNFQLGVALPFQVTSWLGFSPYVAYSYQWQDLVGTDANTWWAGVSANLSF